MKYTNLVFLVLQYILAGTAYAQTEPTMAELEFATAIISNTSESSSDEDVLMASMFAQQYEPSKAADILAIDLGTPEHNQIRYSLTVYYCLSGGTSPICDTPSFIYQLINLDQDNLEPYLYSMLYMINAKNIDGALEAMIQGNAAPQLNSYYFDKLILLRNQLVNSQYPEDKVNEASEGLAGASSLYGLYARVLSVCTERSLVSAGWKAQCLLLGRRLESEGKAAIQNVFGFAIQKDSLGNSASEIEERNSVLVRRDEYNAIRDKASEELEWWFDVSLKTHDLYQNMAQQGEMEIVKLELEKTE